MNTSRHYQYIFPGTIAFSVVLMLIGLSMGHPEQLLSGLWKIVTMQDLLITDYIHIAGSAAAFVNAGLVTIISILIIKLAKDPFNGFTIVEMGLMAGFSLFGKNVFNIWPIILGTWLYARYQKEPFSKYASVALLATALAPLVSYMALGSVHASLPLGVFTGILVGFLLPSLSAYTYKIQNGMNLYNMGFACGLFAMMVVPILTAFGDKPDSVLYWSTGLNFELSLACGALCVVFILIGTFGCGDPAWAVLGRIPAPAEHHRPGTQRLSAYVRRRTGDGEYRHQRSDRHCLCAVGRGRPQRPHSGRHFHHHGFFRLRKASPEHHPRDVRRVAGGLRYALRTQLPGACSWRACSGPRWPPLPATSARYAAYWRGSSTRRWCCRPAARWRD